MKNSPLSWSIVVPTGAPLSLPHSHWYQRLLALFFPVPSDWLLRTRREPGGEAIYGL